MHASLVYATNLLVVNVPSKGISTVQVIAITRVQGMYPV